MSACSSFEVTVERLCKHLQVHLKKGLSVSDLGRENGFRRAATYIKKGLELEFPDNTPTWTAVCEIFNLRNALVHQNGRLAAQGENKQADGVRKLIAAREDLLALRYDDAVILKQACLDWAVQSLVSCLGEVDAALGSTLPHGDADEELRG